MPLPTHHVDQRRIIHPDNHRPAVIARHPAVGTKLVVDDFADGLEGNLLALRPLGQLPDQPLDHTADRS